MAEIVHREKPFEAATPKRARTARQSERRKISGDTAADVLGKAAFAPERQGEGGRRTRGRRRRRRRGPVVGGRQATTRGRATKGGKNGI